MTDKQYRGIFGIPATPFNEDETLDKKGLDSVLNFTVDAGAHGIVVPVMASEYHALDDDERRYIAERAVAISAGRIPVVIGVAGVSTFHSIALAKHAQDTGADAVIAIPPHGRPTSKAEAVRFFHHLGESLEIPVFIQNHNLGYGMDAPTLVELMKTAPNVNYLKEETFFAGQVSTQVIETAGDACYGVMGGSGGRYLPAEFERGICGNMPASHMADVLANIWNKMEAGDMEGARQDHMRQLPLISMEGVYAAPVWKEILVRRGIIQSATVRSPGKTRLDEYDLREIDYLLDSLDDLMTWKA